VIPVKKLYRNGKHRNPEDSCRNRQPNAVERLTSEDKCILQIGIVYI